MNEAEIRKIVDEQADDWGLWCEPRSVVEDILQRALRRLHVAIEGKTEEECAIAALTK